jgi:hypothetical protein
MGEPAVGNAAEIGIRGDPAILRLFVRGRRSIMSTTNLVLLLWAAACLGVAHAAGRIWKTSKFWKWVDPVYYPLAILGIALLFFSNDNARILTDLRDELADTEQQIADLKAAQPPSNAAATAAASWAAEQGRLEASRRARSGQSARLLEPAPLFSVATRIPVLPTRPLRRIR